MWNERRMTSGPGRRRQTRRPALLMRSARIGPVLWCAPVVSTGGRAGRRHLPNPFGASPPFRRGCHPPPEREQESRPGRESRRRATPERTETGRAAPNEGGPRPELRIVEEHSSQRPILWSGLRPRTGGGTPRAIARIEVRAIGSAMWLVRCCCRHRPQRIPGAGAGGVAAIKVAGARAGELAAGSTIEPGGRLKGLGTHPSPSATRYEGGLAGTFGQYQMCT